MLRSLAIAMSVALAACAPGPTQTRVVEIEGWVLRAAVEMVNEEHGGVTNEVSRQDPWSSCGISTAAEPGVWWKETLAGTRCDIQLLKGGSTTSKMRPRCKFVDWVYFWERWEKGKRASTTQVLEEPPPNWAWLDGPPHEETREKRHFFRVWEDSNVLDGVDWENSFTIDSVMVRVPWFAPNFDTETFAAYCFEE